MSTAMIWGWFSYSGQGSATFCDQSMKSVVYLNIHSINQGKPRQSQLLMRGHIFVQGFAVVAIVVSKFATAMRPNSEDTPVSEPPPAPCRSDPNFQTSCSLYWTPSYVKQCFICISISPVSSLWQIHPRQW